MISLAQTALMGIAGYVLGNLVTRGGAGGESKGLILGWDPTLALVLAIVITTAIGVILGLVASRSFGIYFLMLTLTFGVIANYFFGQVTKLGGFSPIAGINLYMPGWIGDVVGHPDKLYYIALGVSLFVYVLIRYLVRTPFGMSFQGQRDEPVRLASLGYTVPLHRALAFGFAAFVASLAGVLAVWWDGQISPQNLGLGATIDLLIIAVIGGLGRDRGGMARRVRVHRDQQLRPRHPVPVRIGEGRASVDRRELQHRDRGRLSADRPALAGWSDGHLGSRVGCRAPTRRSASCPIRRQRACGGHSP